MLPLGLFRRRNFSAGQHRDVLDVCGAVDPVLLPDPVPAADRRLHAAAERPGDAAGDRDHVRALAPLRRAGRSLRPAPVHGRRAAGGGLRAAAVPARRARRSTTSQKCCPALLVFALGPVDDRRAADRRGARRRGAEQAGIASGVNNAIARVAGLLGTAAVGAAIAASFARRSTAAWRARRSGPPARAAVREAKRLPLGRPDVHGLPRRQARALTSAAEQASLHSFHLGMVDRRGAGGRSAVSWEWWGSATRSRRVRAADCAGRSARRGAAPSSGSIRRRSRCAGRLSRRARARRRASRR